MVESNKKLIRRYFGAAGIPLLVGATVRDNGKNGYREGDSLRRLLMETSF